MLRRLLELLFPVRLPGYVSDWDDRNKSYHPPMDIIWPVRSF